MMQGGRGHPGYVGERGSPGPRGAPGPDGAAGKDGVDGHKVSDDILLDITKINISIYS